MCAINVCVFEAHAERGQECHVERAPGLGQNSKYGTRAERGVLNHAERGCALGNFGCVLLTLSVA